MVRDFEDKLRRGDPAPGEEEGRKRSPAMVRRIVTSLSTMIGDAQERGLVARNVVRELHSRRKRGKQKQHECRHNGKRKVGLDIPSPEEIRAFLAALNGQYRPILLTAAFTGLRASELRGLRWADVDLEKRELHVRQRVDKRNVAGPPKSASGERKIPLPPIGDRVDFGTSRKEAAHAGGEAVAANTVHGLIDKGSTLRAIQAALEKVGIEFDADGRGVRLKPAQVFREL